MPPKADIRSLYYITHVDNLPSILRQGILSHSQIERLCLTYVPIYDAEIVGRRKDKNTPDGRSLWAYANAYFQARNPMMYRVVHEKGCGQIAVVAVKPSVLENQHIVITDGNAASSATRFYNAREGLQILRNEWHVLHTEYWNDRDGSKRKIMAECLVPERIAPKHIHTIFVADDKTRQNVIELIGDAHVPVVPEPNMFFQPTYKRKIGNVSLVHGDMFFSSMQTLTVSVNLQGVMGKGLASRAKYQFPDVYVKYQDACRRKWLTATKPYLYKREASLDEELADLSGPLPTQNAVKWFLLFATKRKWRERSRLDDIEGGLNWLKEHYASEGIQSIALPALGCGLGGLHWNEVGPLMFRYLHGLPISVAIYLPRERQTDDLHLSEDYLLGNRNS